MALLDEMADGERILRRVARCKALVGHVEEGEELLLLQWMLVAVWCPSADKDRQPTLTMSDISFHCSWVGSTPVGLCAQA